MNSNWGLHFPTDSDCEISLYPATRADELNDPDGRWPLATTTSALLKPNLIPPEFAHGATAVWVMDRSPSEAPPK